MTKGPDTGRCNICGDFGPLTRDHSPPKGCVKPTPVVLHHAVDRLGAEPHTKVGRILQDGVSFRTLCGRCNSSRLGIRYDPLLIDFAATASRVIESPLLLRSVDVKTRPQLLVRSVFGHIAAQGIDRFDKGPLTDGWARWFLDESEPMPDWATFHCWLYPYKRQVLWRDAFLTQWGTGRMGHYWLMKFYPLAFCIWHPTTAPFPLYAADLSKYSVAPDDEVVVSIPLRPVYPELELEAPHSDMGIFLGAEAMSAMARDPRGALLKVRKR